MRTTVTLLLTLVLGVLTAALQAQPTPGFTRFLVPVYGVDVPGAYGSLWRPETWVRYSGIEVMRMAPIPYACPFECPLGGPVNPSWPPLRLRHIIGYPESAILVHVETQYASQVTFATRIRDLSRAALSGGTEVPVVREDRMSAGPICLLNVPVDLRFRQTLRVFALPDVERPEVEVRYFRQPIPSGRFSDIETRLLRAERIARRTRASTDEFQFFPAIAEVGNVEMLSELAGESTIWVEIVPLTPGLRIWALLSITNNETQQVTIISPQQ